MTDNGAMDKLKGKAKELAGKVTGDKRKTSEGQADQVKGGAKGVAGDAKDRVEGVKDSLTDKKDDDR